MRNKNVVLLNCLIGDFKLMLLRLFQVIVTERAGQAYDVMTSITNRELCSYDGVVTVVSVEFCSCAVSCMLRLLVLILGKP